MVPMTIETQERISGSVPAGGLARILVVDDEKIERDPLRIFLSQAGYGVDVAASGEEGLQKAVQQHFDLILTDLKMPGMNGIEMIKAIRERDPLVSCILLTAYPDMDSAIDALNLGVFKYVRKPFQLIEVKHTVEQCLAKKQRAKDGEERYLVLRGHIRRIARTAHKYRALVEEIPGVVYPYNDA